MNSIEKSNSFFRNHVTLFAGSLFLITGILSAWDYSFLSAGLYILIGGSGILIGLNNRNVDKQFIKWDNDCISIKDSAIIAHYNWEEIEEITLDQDHLKIKSGRANGIILDLEGYSKIDLGIIKNELLPFNKNRLASQCKGSTEI